MSLPLSLETFVTNLSLGDNKGAKRDLGVVGGKTENASCSELGDEDASCSGFEVSNSRGSIVLCTTSGGSRAHGQASFGPQERTLPDKPFSDHLRTILHPLCPIGNGLLQPGIESGTIID